MPFTPGTKGREPRDARNCSAESVVIAAVPPNKVDLFVCSRSPRQKVKTGWFPARPSVGTHHAASVGDFPRDCGLLASLHFVTAIAGGATSRRYPDFPAGFHGRPQPHWGNGTEGTLSRTQSA